MPRKFTKTKKNPFDALPPSFKDAVEGASLDDLKARLSEVAKTEEQNQCAMKADEDLKKKRESVKWASQGYREGTKLAKLKTKYLIQAMADKGDEVAANIVKLDFAANALNANV